MLPHHLSVYMDTGIQHVTLLLEVLMIQITPFPLNKRQTLATFYEKHPIMNLWKIC